MLLLLPEDNPIHPIYRPDSIQSTLFRLYVLTRWAYLQGTRWAYFQAPGGPTFQGQGTRWAYFARWIYYPGTSWAYYTGTRWTYFPGTKLILLSRHQVDLLFQAPGGPTFQTRCTFFFSHQVDLLSRQPGGPTFQTPGGPSSFQGTRWAYYPGNQVDLLSMH